MGHVLVLLGTTMLSLKSQVHLVLVFVASGQTILPGRRRRLKAVQLDSSSDDQNLHRDFGRRCGTGPGPQSEGTSLRVGV